MLLTPNTMKPIAAVAAHAVASPAMSLLAQKAFMLSGGPSSATAALSSMAAPAAISLALRGGGPAPPPFDLTRARIRLEGLHSYSVVTTLMLNASLRLFSSTPKPIVEGEKSTNIAKILFIACIVASVISGLYTTVVFSLLGMYAKTAIGMNKDLADVHFFESTAVFREQAFHTFIISLLTFNSSFILSLFINYKGEMKWWVAGSASTFSILSWWQWNSILGIASKLIFN